VEAYKNTARQVVGGIGGSTEKRELKKSKNKKENHETSLKEKIPSSRRCKKTGSQGDTNASLGSEKGEAVHDYNRFHGGRVPQ